MSLRILLLGQKRFGESAWCELKNSTYAGLETMAVCTNYDPDRVWWNSNRIFLDRGDIQSVDNNMRNDDALLDIIKKKKIDLILSVQHPWILSDEVLRAVNYNAINFHNAKLPEYKGYNATNHAILNMETSFVCTAHWMNKEVDAGELVFESSFELTGDETSVSLYAKSFHAGMMLFRKVLLWLSKGKELPRKRMDMAAGHFYPRSSIEKLREIETGEQIDLKARAFYFPPFEPAYRLSDSGKVYCLPATGVELLNRGLAWNLDVLDFFIRETQGVKVEIY